jgi:hypothetical protein
MEQTGNKQENFRKILPKSTKAWLTKPVMLSYYIKSQVPNPELAKAGCKRGVTPQEVTFSNTHHRCGCYSKQWKME